MSTRHSARVAPPRVGEARVVIVAFGVWVVRVWVLRMTVTARAPTIDNVVDEIVNVVVDDVN
jgi:hypothetical protein